MVSCVTGERLCFICKKEEAWHSCRDCDTTPRDFCYGCWDQHHSSRIEKGHSFLDFVRHPLPLLQELKCKQHKARLLEQDCFKCENLPCIECRLIKDNCPSSPGVTGKHESAELTETLAEAKREEIERSLMVSSTRKADGGVFSGELDLLERKSVDQQERLEVEAKMLCKDLLKKGAAHFKSVQETITGSRKKVSEYMANQDKFSNEARELLSSPCGIQVYLQAPAVVESLSTPFDLILPTIPTAVFKPSIAVGALVTSTTPQTDVAGSTTLQEEGAESATTPQEEGDESTTTTLTGEVGSTTPQGVCLVMNGKQWEPTDRCTVESSVGPVVVEAFGPHGLYSSHPGSQKAKVHRKGGSMGHWAVCTGMDNKVVYSITRDKTIIMYSTKNGKLVQISEVPVKRAKGLSHIREGPATGNLIVVDELFPRLTIHSPNCTLLRPIGPKLTGGIILRVVVAAEWSPCEKFLYLIDLGKDKKDETVMKLSLTLSPHVVWKKSLRGFLPEQVFAIDSKVYITHRMESKITVLSPDDGAILKVIRCPGRVREVKPAATGKLELVYYKKLKG